TASSPRAASATTSYPSRRSVAARSIATMFSSSTTKIDDTVLSAQVLAEADLEARAAAIQELDAPAELAHEGQDELVAERPRLLEVVAARQTAAVVGDDERELAMRGRAQDHRDAAGLAVAEPVLEGVGDELVHDEAAGDRLVDAEPDVLVGGDVH